MFDNLKKNFEKDIDIYKTMLSIEEQIESSQRQIEMDQIDR